MALHGAEDQTRCAAQADDGEEKQSIVDAELLLDAYTNVGMSEIGNDSDSK